MGFVLRFCASRGLDAHDAADLTAEVFAGVLQARYRFDPERGVARSWLLGFAERRLVDRRRRWTRDDRARRDLQLAAIELTARDIADYAALRTEIAEATAELEALPAGQRAAGACQAR